MKRIITMFSIIMLLCICVSASPIYKYEDTVPITDTVSLTNVREFYADYNISYSYIKMDLTDDRVKLKLLTSNDGTDVLSYMSDLAKTDENTVAALNADFFSVYSGNKGFSLGIEKQDGEIVQSPINPDTMATVAYDGQNVLMTYLDFHVMAVAPNWEYKEIRHINKHTSYYGDLLMYTHEFNGGYSPAPGGDVVEVVIEDGVVKEFRRNMEPCLIPENGCVLVVSEGSTMFLANNLSVGDKIHFDWYVTPSLDDFDTAFGGGSMLVYEGKDVGKVGDYTHTVAGLNPRSAIGIDEAGTTLYLVAVDGRQEGSQGMRMSHLAELMIELGCYTAVNLDGGGSTRMIASTLWDFDMHPVNNPTENRKVINAVGIVLNKPNEQDGMAEEEMHESAESEELQEQQETVDDYVPETQDVPLEKAESEIAGIKIKPSRATAFVGEKIEFEIVVHDEQLRPVLYDGEQVEFSVTRGEMENGVLVSHEGGTVTVGAFLGGHYAETSVYYIDNVSGIVTDSVLYMQKGESRELPVSVFDYEGRFIEVQNMEPFEIISSDESVVSVNKNIITAQKDGTALVTVSKDGIKSFVSIAVGTYPVNYLYDFEKLKGTFTSYPTDTKGSFELSDEFALSGSFSGKLGFDFTENSTAEAEYPSEKEDASRAVYFSLNDKVVFDEENNSVQINVYSENDFLHEVRAQLVDGTGKVNNLKFDGTVLAETWNTLTLEVPETLARPVSLSRVYVLYTPGEEKDEGCIYIDDISMTTRRDYTPVAAPENVYRHNTNNSNVNSKVTVSAVPSWNNNNPITLYESARIKNAVLSENGIVISDSMKKSVSEDDNAVYVYLDTSNGGIRSTDSSQWELLTQAVESSKRKNLFVIVNDGIFGNDEFENEVVRDYLASVNKNVFVVSGGESASYIYLDGVKYFTVDSTPITEFSLTSNKRSNAVEFFFGDTVTFDFKSV